jgi:hypothetical protein
LGEAAADINATAEAADINATAEAADMMSEQRQQT